MKTEYKKININKLYNDYKLLGEWLNRVKNGVKPTLSESIASESDFDSEEYLICWLHEYLDDWESDVYEWNDKIVHRWQSNSHTVECEIEYGEYTIYLWGR